MQPKEMQPSRALQRHAASTQEKTKNTMVKKKKANTNGTMEKKKVKKKRVRSSKLLPATPAIPRFVQKRAPRAQPL